MNYQFQFVVLCQQRAQSWAKVGQFVDHYTIMVDCRVSRVASQTQASQSFRLVRSCDLEI